MADGMNVAHVAICVSDLERSTRFYADALGFVEDFTVDIDGGFDALTELPGAQLRVAFLNGDGARIELAAYRDPPAIGRRERRPMNQLGLTHLSIVVADVDAVAERIVALGGRVLAHTRTRTPAGDLMFCTDPDGTRIELWRR